MIDSPGVHSHAQGASLIQVELGLGRNAIVILWFSAIVSAAAVIAMLFFIFELREANARYAVLQYDHQALKAQLVAKGVYDGTEH